MHTHLYAAPPIHACWGLGLGLIQLRPRALVGGVELKLNLKLNPTCRLGLGLIKLRQREQPATWRPASGCRVC